MAVAVKIGPWGAEGGQYEDISTEPKLLNSFTICSSDYDDQPRRGILGFSFVYDDQQNVGPWGHNYDQYPITQIPMGPGEHIIEVSGTSDGAILTSLKLVTNRANRGPYGRWEGPAFKVPLQHGNGKVVGFFGYDDDTIKALGIYVPVYPGKPIKVGLGPWGDRIGEHVDINATPVQLTRVTVYYEGRINGFSFNYIDLNNHTIDSGTWGTENGQMHTFRLEQGEYVNGISGTTADGYGVTSLKFTTNLNRRGHGPFGGNGGTAFSVPLPDGTHNGAVVGFFGVKGDSLLALGVYVGLAPNP